jgi:rRNA maturation RNase YbeY
VPVDLRCEIERGRPFAASLRRRAQKLLELLDLGQAELSLMLLGDAQIRRLNREYRGHDATTDVLSFPQLEEGSALTDIGAGGSARSDRPPLPLGDIAISIETASRQARATRITVASRLQELLIHGFLHLLGYDHERSPAEARRQFTRERELAAALPFADAQSERFRQPRARRR